jgi:hypothetical protein
MKPKISLEKIDQFKQFVKDHSECDYDKRVVLELIEIINNLKGGNNQTPRSKETIQ